MKLTFWTASLIAITTVIGCNQTKQPTYAEAVQLYEAEMAELERLEARRDKLEAAMTGRSGAIDQQQLLRDLAGGLGNVGELQRELGEATAGLIDEKALGDNEKLQEGLKLLEKQAKQDAVAAAKTLQENEELKAVAEKELPELKIKIEAQQKRVETARKVKEALAPK